MLQELALEQAFDCRHDDVGRYCGGLARRGNRLAGGSFSSYSAGPRAPAMTTMRSSPSISGGGGSSFRSEPRFQRFNNNSDRVVTDDGKVKGKGKGKRRPPTLRQRSRAMCAARASSAQEAARPRLDRRHWSRWHRSRQHRPRGAGLAAQVFRVQVLLIPVRPEPARLPRAPLRSAFTLRPSARNASSRMNWSWSSRAARPSIAQVLGRQGLVQLESQYFALTDSTIVRARIINGRSVRVALPGLVNETTAGRLSRISSSTVAAAGDRSTTGRPRRRRRRWRPRQRSRQAATRRNTLSRSFTSGKRTRLPTASACWSR